MANKKANSTNLIQAATHNPEHSVTGLRMKARGIAALALLSEHVGEPDQGYLIEQLVWKYADQDGDFARRLNENLAAKTKAVITARSSGNKAPKGTGLTLAATGTK